MTRCLPLAVAVLLTNLARAEDWTQFRGPGCQGHSAAKNLPVEWSRTKNVTWMAPLPGEGWSSPIVLKDLIYLTAAEPVVGGGENDRSLRVLCLNAADGKIAFNVEVFRQKHAATQRIHRKNSHASPTPITDGKHVFVHFGTQGTACLSLDGKIVWRHRELRYSPQHGNGGSPILFEDLVIVSCDGSDVQFVAAMNKSDGKIRWKKDRPTIGRTSRRFSFTTPLVIEVGGKSQLISPATDVVVAYNPRNGDEIWKFTYDGYSVIPRPVYSHGLVFVCTGYGRPVLYAIRPTGSGDVTSSHLAWKTVKAVPHTPSVLVVGDELYFVSDRGVASCLDAESGELHWQQRIDGNYSASPVFADGKIYWQSERGDTTVIEPGVKFERIARSKLGERTLASCAIAGGAIFLRSDKGLYRIEKK